DKMGLGDDTNFKIISSAATAIMNSYLRTIPLGWNPLKEEARIKGLCDNYAENTLLKKTKAVLNGLIAIWEEHKAVYPDNHALLRAFSDFTKTGIMQGDLMQADALEKFMQW